MNPSAIPFIPHKDLPPHFGFSTQVTIIQNAIKTVSIGKRRDRHHLPADQKVVIRTSSGERTRIVFEDYPLLNLLTYSCRARRELAQHAKATWTGATLQWVIKLRNNTDLILSGFRMLLDFWKTLPPTGFPQDYLLTPGVQRPAICDSWIRPLSQLDLLYLNDAYLELEPAYPLDNRKPRNAISQTLLFAPTRLGCFTLGTLWDLFSDVDTGLVERACLKFINERGQKELEDDTSFDCYNFTPSLQLKLTRMREEKLDLIVLGVLPSWSSSGMSSSVSSILGKPKRKTRRGKKKPKKTAWNVISEMEVIDDKPIESDTTLSQGESSYRNTPRTTPPSSPVQPGSAGKDSLQSFSSSISPNESPSER